MLKWFSVEKNCSQNWSSKMTGAEMSWVRSVRTPCYLLDNITACLRESALEVRE